MKEKIAWGVVLFAFGVALAVIGFKVLRVPEDLAFWRNVVGLTFISCAGVVWAHINPWC